MGWLHDSMKDARVRSFAALAKKVATQADGDARGSQNVANYLRNLDKGQHIEWWLSGAGKQYAGPLADAFDLELEELRDHIRDGDRASNPEERQRYWPFHMFPDLRRLDLMEERLFPGIPDALVSTNGPTAARTWWVAEAGAGKTLVGRWLEMKHRWERFEARTWTEALKVLPEAGKVYLELFEDDGEYDVSRVPVSLRLCVAAPFRPRAKRRPKPEPSPSLRRRSRISRPEPWEDLDSLVDRDTDAEPDPWNIVETPDPERWLQPLLTWVARRVPPDGGFEQDGVTRQLKGLGLELFTTPGQVLDFCGLIDQVGLPDTHPADPDRLRRRWIRAWFKHACDRADRTADAAIQQTLKGRGDALLVDLEVERLRRALPASQSRAAWVALFPQRFAVDPERAFIRQLAEANPPDLAQQLRRATEPSPDELLDGLESIGALSRSGEDRVTLHPAWLAQFVHELAMRRLQEDAPLGLGALLLNPETVRDTLSALSQKISANPEFVIGGVLSMVDADVPDSLVVLDGIFQATAIAIADGASLPGPLLRRLWDLWVEMTRIPRGGVVPEPLIGIAQADDVSASTRISEAQARAFAVLTLGLALVRAGHAPPRSILFPWRGWPEDERERSASEGLVLELFSSQTSEPLGVNALWRETLADALFDSFGVLSQHGYLVAAHRHYAFIEWASRLPSEATVSDASVARLNFDLHALERACKRLKYDLDRLFAQAWRQWCSRTEPAPRWGWWWQVEDARPALDWRERIWRNLPAECIDAVFLNELSRCPSVLDWLSESVWDKIVECSKGIDSISLYDLCSIFKHLPAHRAESLLRAFLTTRDAWDLRSTLVMRSPEILPSILAELASREFVPTPEGCAQSPLTDLLFCVTDPWVPAVFAQIESWIEDRTRFPGVPDNIELWLLHMVRTKRPAWREAWRLLRQWQRPRQPP